MIVVWVSSFPMVRGIRQQHFARPRRKIVKHNLSMLLKSRKSSETISVFGEWGVQMYSDGKISSSDLGEGAAATASEGSASSVVRRLSKAKPPRKRLIDKKLKPDTRHSARNLQRALEPGCLLPPSYEARIPTWDVQKNK